MLLAWRLLDVVPRVQQLCQMDTSLKQLSRPALAKLAMASAEFLRALAEVPRLADSGMAGRAHVEAATASADAASSGELLLATSGREVWAAVEAATQWCAACFTREVGTWEAAITSDSADTSRSAFSVAALAHLRAAVLPLNGREADQHSERLAELLRGRQGRAHFAAYAASVLGELHQALSQQLEFRGQDAAYSQDLVRYLAADHPAALPPGEVGPRCSCEYDIVLMRPAIRADMARELVM